MKKYELHIIQCPFWMCNEKLQQYQKLGWELAGNISIENESNNARIPIKKLLT